MIFITGFEEHELTSNNYVNAMIGQLEEVGTNPFDLKTDAVFSADQSLDGVQVDFNPIDPDDTVTHIQLSMIMIAVREYDATEYPYQIVKDTFTASFGPLVYVQDISDPSVTVTDRSATDFPVIDDFKNQ